MNCNQIKVAPHSEGGRIEWVDTAKVLGLFLVFWGHLLYGGSPVADVINRAIYSFHMPMYFILSGYVLKPEQTSFCSYFNNKFKRVLLPALLLYFLTLPKYFFSLDYSLETTYSILSRVFYVEGKCAYNTPVWFFFCLFQIIVVAKLLNLANASNKKIIVVAVLSLIISFLIYNFNLTPFKYLGINKCILGLFFYTFGMILRRTEYKDHTEIIGYAAVMVWLLSGVVLNTNCTMNGMALGNFWLFILSSVTGSIVFFTFCKSLDRFNNEKFVVFLRVKIREFTRWTVFIV